MSVWSHFCNSELQLSVAKHVCGGHIAMGRLVCADHDLCMMVKCRSGPFCNSGLQLWVAKIVARATIGIGVNRAVPNWGK